MDVVKMIYMYVLILIQPKPCCKIISLSCIVCLLLQELALSLISIQNDMKNAVSTELNSDMLDIMKQCAECLYGVPTSHIAVEGMPFEIRNSPLRIQCLRHDDLCTPVTGIHLKHL